MTCVVPRFCKFPECDCDHEDNGRHECPMTADFRMSNGSALGAGERNPLARYSDNEKPTNPKDALGIKKAPMSCVSAPVLAELGLAMLEGALKYGRHNYRAVGVRSSVYYDALMRHMFAWWEGEDIDPDSGISHLAKAMACLAVLRDSMIRGNLNDDRPLKVKDGWLNDLNKRAGDLIDKYPNPALPHTQRDESWTDVRAEDPAGTIYTIPAIRP